MVETAVRRTPKVAASEWLKDLGPATRLAFYGDAKARAAAAPVWGAEFSDDACRANFKATRATLWLGPDEYLLLDLAAGGSAADLAAQLAGALGGIPHALVDVSHRQFALEVSGPHAAVILNGACPLDLDLTQFPVGMCTRTVLAKADIVLWRTRPDAFHLEVWRSFAGYVVGILSEMALEFYPNR
jgi:sarcosine oxidase, subunit gamma